MSNEYKKALLAEKSTVLEAIKIIDLASLQIVLIVDRDEKLVGTITDGDIRRGILNGISLEDPVERVMNVKPRVADQTATREQMLSIMTELKIHQLPIIDDSGHIVGLAQIDKLAGKSLPSGEDNVDVWVVLMLGGLGSRLLPLTEDVPKPMIEIGGKPLLENIINTFFTQGFKNFYFSVNYKSDVIKDYFGDGSKFGVNIVYLDEEKRMGTAGALSLLPTTPKSPLIVMNGDILTNNNFSHLINFHRQTNASATMCVREYHQQVPYGVVQTKGSKLHSITEKPSQTYFVNAGIYVINPKVLDHVKDEQYLDMPDLFNKLEEMGEESAVFPIREYWLDIGNLKDLEQGRGEFDKIFKTGNV